MECLAYYWGFGITFTCIASIMHWKKGDRLKVVDVFFILIGALFWPLFLALILHSMITKTTGSEDKKFEVFIEDLDVRLTIADIEEQHYVFDPLESVPQQPFGFLNNAWASFCETETDNDNEVSFWSFEKEDPTTWKPEVKKGYAKLNSKNEVVDWFVYESLEIDN